MHSSYNMSLVYQSFIIDCLPMLVETFKHNLLHFIPTLTSSRENYLKHLYKKKNDNVKGTWMGDRGPVVYF